jgi:hypothetical protein
VSPHFARNVSAKRGFVHQPLAITPSTHVRPPSPSCCRGTDVGRGAACDERQVFVLVYGKATKIKTAMHNLVELAPVALATKKLPLLVFPPAPPLVPCTPHLSVCAHPRRERKVSPRISIFRFENVDPQAPRTTATASSSYRNSTAFIWHSSGDRCPPRRPPALNTSRPSSPEVLHPVGV